MLHGIDTRGAARMKDDASRHASCDDRRRARRATVRLELRERVAELALDNGPLNLVTSDLLRALNRALAECRASARTFVA